MGEQTELIRIENITKRFGGTTALDNVSFTINQGEVHAIVGENGAGKSTLMKILAGVERQDSGNILLNGRLFDVFSPAEAKEAGISMVFQELNNFPQLSVYENIFITKELKTKTGLLARNKMRQKSVDLIKMLEREHNISPEAKLGDLSVADQQVVEIVRALSFESDIIILDEPNSALSDCESVALFEMIRRLKNSGITILYISHRLEEVFSISDRVTTLRDGKFIGTMAIEETTIPEVIGLMIGTKLEDVFPDRRTRKKNGNVILQVSKLSKKSILKNVSFDIREGEVVGFAGLEGCGIEKITRILFGLENFDEGSIRYEGRPVDSLNPWKAIDKGWALVPAERHRQGLMTEWSVKDNISIGIINRLLNKAGLINQGAMKRLARKSIETLHIATDSIDKRVLDLSGGNQQKVVISKWLATDPKLIILNDPTRGIDVGAKAEIYKLIDKLAREGYAIFFTSSEFEEVIGLSDRVIVIYEGEVTEEFFAADISKNELMSYVNGSNVCRE